MTLRSSLDKPGVVGPWKNAGILALFGLVSLGLGGCPQPPAPPAAVVEEQPARPVRMLVVDDPGLAAAIEREWRASGQGELVVSQMKPSELPTDQRLAADCVIYPSGLLGQLVSANQIVPLPDYATQNEKLAWGDVFSLIRLREVNWSAKTYALPLGSPVLTLVYRRDILEKLGRAPPKTWREYQELIELLDDRSKLTSQLGPEFKLPANWRAAVEPLGSGWAGQTLLARAAAAAHHEAHFSTLFDIESMEPLIDGPAFVRALEELVAASRAMPAGAIEADPSATRDAIARGEVGVALTWLSPHLGEGQAALPPVPCGVTIIPGAAESYNFRTDRWEPRHETSHVPLLSISGRFGSVTTNARHTRAAVSAVAWLASSEVAVRLAAGSSAITLTRQSQVSQPEAWAGRPFDRQSAGEYAKAVSSSLNARAWLSSPAIPGRARYLSALDDAVRKAVRGEEQPAAALKTAADRWREITKELGIDKQREAYQRSLGT